MRLTLVLIILIFFSLFSTISFALNSETKEFIGCSLIESDLDFLINVTNCNETFIAGELTFNPTTSKNSLTGWFNVTGDYISSGQFTIRKSATNKIPFALYLKDLKIDLSKINLVLKWGTNSSTVSVTQNSVYRVSGNDNTYSVDFQKSSCTTGKPCGSESNITIFNYNLPPYTTTTFKGFSNGTLGNAITIGKANSSLIESGPARVVIVAQNLSNNMCDGSANNGCLNYTNLVYAYPTFYQNYYVFTFNKSLGLTQGGSGLGFVIIQTTPNNTDNPRFDEVNNRTVNGASYSYSIDMGTGGDSVPLGNANTSIGFAFDDADHNRTVLWKNTITNFTNNTITYAGQDSTERMAFGFGSLTGKELNPAGTYAFGYLVMFGQNGQKTVANNQTVWNLDFEEQYRAWYNPASMTAIVGSQQSRNNITGSYNYTANGTYADFNFTTIAGMNYTYPVFEIQNISNISAVKVFWKNYTASSNWAELTNWTDYVLQEGNSSYFGYNYVLLLINKTLGWETANAETYEFMVNNTTIAAPPAGTQYNGTGILSLTLTNVGSRKLNASRPSSSSLSLSTSSTRKEALARLSTLSISMTNIATKIFMSNKLSTLSLSIASSSSRIINAGRLLSQTLSLSNIASRIFGTKKLSTISLTLGNLAAKNFGVQRLNILSLSLASSASRVIRAVRTPSLSITLTNIASGIKNAGTQAYNYLASLALSLANSASRAIKSIRLSTLSLSIANIGNRLASRMKPPVVSLSLSTSSSRIYNAMRNPSLSLLLSVSSTRKEALARLSTLSISMTNIASGVKSGLQHEFAALASVLLSIYNQAKAYIGGWIEIGKVYDVCSILEQIEDSPFYICVKTDGTWKILIRGIEE